MATIHDAEIKLVRSALNMNLPKDVSDIVYLRHVQLISGYGPDSNSSMEPRAR